MKSKSISGVKDIDRYILDKLSDTDFLKIYSVNKIYYNNICNEEYFRIRTEQRYPETIPFKKFKTTWKKYYLDILYYKNMLVKFHMRVYRPEEKSPKLLYKCLLLHSEIHDYCSFNRHRTLIYGCRFQKFSLVKYLIDIGACNSKRDDYSIGYSVQYCNHAVLVEACGTGNIEIVKYLLEHKIGTEYIQEGILKATEYKHLLLTEYLSQIQNEIN